MVKRGSKSGEAEYFMRPYRKAWKERILQAYR